MLALPSYLLTAGLSCTASEESASTHPSGDRRLLLMAQAVKEFVAMNADFRRAAQARGLLELLEDEDNRVYGYPRGKVGATLAQV